MPTAIVELTFSQSCTIAADGKRARRAVRIAVVALAVTVCVWFVTVSTFMLAYTQTRHQPLVRSYKQFSWQLSRMLGRSSLRNLQPLTTSPPWPEMKNEELVAENCSFKSKFLRMPSSREFSMTPGGAKAFLDSLLRRQARVQRCMQLGHTPWRTIVHQCLPAMNCGGLGDRLRGSAMALLVAAITSRALFIDHQKPAGTALETYLEPRSEDVDWRLSSMSGRARTMVRSAVRKSDIDTPGSGGCMVFARHWTGLYNRAAIHWNTNIPPVKLCVAMLVKEYFVLEGRAAANLVLTIAEKDLTRLPLRRLFKPTALVRSGLSAMIGTVFSGEEASARQNGGKTLLSLPADCTLCFHIRTGRNIGTSAVIDPLLTENIGDFARCGEMVANHFMSPGECKPGSERKWLVVTDNYQTDAILSALKNHSGTADVITTSSLGPLVHLDRYAPKQLANTSELLAGVLHAFIDFHLLQECRHIIRSPSQFSLMAILSGDALDKDLRHYTVPHNRPCVLTDLDRHLYPDDERSM